MVYSSLESIEQAILTGRGIYYSRSRKGLWEKGKTSGATQLLKYVEVDCDSDALKFTVQQKAPGFCHLERMSCFGKSQGLVKLFETLVDRKENAPEGSYTAKLFSNPEMLHAKIREEADELCQAKTRDEVCWEAADVFYFALAKCAKLNVSLADIENHLDQRSLKVSRRPGAIKPQYASAAKTEETVEPSLNIRVFEADAMSHAEKARLLQRPIMDTQTITARVQPIINAVREKGDAAVLESTEKFDGIC